MYFVHPQFKTSFQTFCGLFFCLLLPKNKKIQKKVEAMFPNKAVYFTDMGRTAFRLIVEELGLQNTEMLLPAYTCDIFLPILKQYNIKPIFLDPKKETCNLGPGQIESKITAKTRSILITHTYGLPFPIEQAVALAEKYELKVIEDCAHCFGNRYKGKHLGNFGDAALFSLYKLFPCLRGGLAVLPKASAGLKLQETRFTFRDFLSLLNCFPIFSFLFKKYASRPAQKHLKQEKRKSPSGINSVSLNIFAWQCKKLNQTLAKKREMALGLQAELKKLDFDTQFSENNSFTFLSCLCPKRINRDQLVLALRAKGVFATRIWKKPIVMNKEAQKEYNFKPEQFPNTIEIASRIINFPLQNFYTQRDIFKIVSRLKRAIASARR